MATNAQSQSQQHSAPETVYLKDYQAPDWRIQSVDLHVALYDSHALVTSSLSLEQVSGTKKPLVLDGELLTLESIALDGQPLKGADYQIKGDQLTVFELPESATLKTTVRIEPQNNTALEGLYRSGGMFCTQCEADGFRRITYFLDRPDVLSVYRTTVEADKAEYPVLLSNGNPVDSGDLESGRHFVSWEDPFPKPCYLFALVAGDLHLEQSSFITASGRTVDLRLYVEPQNADKCEHAMVSLKNAMRWDEETYGLEYDLDIYMVVAVDDFNMGAMENKGLNIFNSRFVLARPEIAEDSDYEDIEAVIGHEYFHNWTGNRVTCRDWFQLSLKEGLTVFREQEFSADMNARSVKRIADVRRLRSFQFPEDAGPTAHPVRPDSYSESNNLYTATVYEKGGEVIRMLHGLVGKVGFRAGMDLYFERHDGQAVTCEDFVAAIADANQIDLTAYLCWYTQAGTPKLTMQQQYHERAQQLTLSFSQETLATAAQPDKTALPIPIAVGLLDADGQSLKAELNAGVGRKAEGGWVLELATDEADFVFSNVSADAVPSVLRGFSAPVELATDLSRAQKLLLLKADSDAFARWDAGQQLAMDELSALVGGEQDEVASDFVAACGEAIERVLAGGDNDFALYAELLTFPDEGALVNRLARVDVHSIHHAVSALREGLAKSLKSQWLALYEHCHAQADEASARALRNVALKYVAAADPRAANELAVAQMRNARCMTDSMGALKVAVNAQLASADDLLETFYSQWQQEPLVVNKWLSVQAARPGFDALDTVRRLTKHEAFDITNPNKVRALFNMFAAWNPVGFHGGGKPAYSFIADQVLRLNELNPQVAARLVGAFNHWRKFDGEARLEMQQQLQRIQMASGLSRAVADIVNKSLA